MRVELQSIFKEIKRLKPSNIALVVRNLKEKDEWEDGAKVVRKYLEGGAEKFSSELVKEGIRCIDFQAAAIKATAEEILKCDMCVVAGEPFYSLLGIATSVREIGFSRPIFMEITSDEAERRKFLQMAKANALRLGAPELLNRFSYLTRKRGAEKFIEFSDTVGQTSPTPEERVKVFVEGKVKPVILSQIERNPAARKACIRARGVVCSICDFDFSERFGKAGAGLIHVHHLKQVAETRGQERVVDPLVDLLPVCPNCHYFIHSRTPMYSVEEVRSLLRPE